MKSNHRNNFPRRALGRFALLSVSLVAGTAITAAAQDKNDAGTKPGGSGKKPADFLTKWIPITKLDQSVVYATGAHN